MKKISYRVYIFICAHALFGLGFFFFCAVLVINPIVPTLNLSNYFVFTFLVKKCKLK